MYIPTDISWLLEIKSLLQVDIKRCINNIKSNKECSACVDICPTNAIDNDLTVNVSSCTLCGACYNICPTNAIILGLNQIDFINSLEQKQICVGCARSSKAEVIVPCILNFTDKDVLCLSDKDINFDTTPCENCNYQFSYIIKRMISKMIYLSKIFRLNVNISTNIKDYKPKFKKFYPKENLPKRCFNMKKEGLCQNTIPFDGKFGYIELSEDCNLCGACVSICPEKAIKIDGESINFAHGFCIGCGLCEYACACSNSLKPLLLKRMIIPSKYNDEFNKASNFKKCICEQCGKIFYAKQDIKLCLYCQKEANLNNMILHLLNNK